MAPFVLDLINTTPTGDLAFLTREDGQPFATLTPERRLFRVQQRQVAETSIHTNLMRDLYATLGEGDAAQGWVVVE